MPVPLPSPVPTSPMGRRRFLGLTGVLAGAVALSACGGRSSTQEATSTLRWWDQFKPLASFEENLFAEFAKQPGGLEVDYTTYNPDEQGQALQLAFQSEKLPDVFTTAGLQTLPAKLFRDGWFSPVQIDEATKARLPKAALLEGETVFDGKPYSYPVLGYRQYNTLAWWNRDLLEAAGLDPGAPPATWDEFRAAALAVRRKGGDGVYGWVAPLKFTGRLSEHVHDLAQAAGAPTAAGLDAGGGFDLRTGEYAYHTDPYVHAIEFLLSLRADDVLFPASTSLDARTARARWTTGKVGAFFDGPWNAGVVKGQFEEFLDTMAVGSVPTPEQGQTPALYRSPGGGTFWIASGSEHVEAASKLIAQFTLPEHQISLAETMDGTPADPSVVAKADVHPTYRTAVELFGEQVFLAPSVVSNNPAIAEVYSAMNPVKPNLGEIVQGAFTGDITDVRGALKKLSDQLTAERERTIAEVNKEGAEVAVEDWQFADWTPGQDYDAASSPQ